VLSLVSLQFFRDLITFLFLSRKGLAFLFTSRKFILFNFSGRPFGGGPSWRPSFSEPCCRQHIMIFHSISFSFVFYAALTLGCCLFGPLGVWRSDASSPFFFPFSSWHCRRPLLVFGANLLPHVPENGFLLFIQVFLVI